MNVHRMLYYPRKFDIVTFSSQRKIDIYENTVRTVQQEGFAKFNLVNVLWVFLNR